MFKLDKKKVNADFLCQFCSAQGTKACEKCESRLNVCQANADLHEICDVVRGETLRARLEKARRELGRAGQV